MRFISVTRLYITRISNKIRTAERGIHKGGGVSTRLAPHLAVGEHPLRALLGVDAVHLRHQVEEEKKGS
jgi:hypothetical protein